MNKIETKPAPAKPVATATPSGAAPKPSIQFVVTDNTNRVAPPSNVKAGNDVVSTEVK